MLEIFKIFTNKKTELGFLCECRPMSDVFLELKIANSYLTIAIPFLTSSLQTACTSRLVLPADMSAALYVSYNERFFYIR